METKYGFDIPEESIKANMGRLINQLWKLIPMRENEEDWHKQLNTVILEISGLNVIFASEPLFLQLLTKLEGLNIQEDCDFMVYRKIVFECISLLSELKR